MIKSLDSCKSHGCDISIKMIKICSDSVTIALKIIFEESSKKGIFPEIWKKTNAVPIHNKEDKTLIKITVPLVYFLFLVKYLKR